MHTYDRRIAQVQPWRTTTTITITRIRMSGPEYAKKIKGMDRAHIAKNKLLIKGQ